MHFRSLSDLRTTLLTRHHLVTQDVDLIVGIPRSGMLAASILALQLNVPMTDLDGLKAGRLMSTGTTRSSRARLTRIEDCRRILVLDDTILTGQSMRRARQSVSGLECEERCTWAAVYGLEQRHPEVDAVLEVCPQPRLFEWNFMHLPILNRACLDLDGVLCVDPTPEQNDDGKRYAEFIRSAVPLYSPSCRIRAIVTSRLEKYRATTSKWLDRHGIQYEELVMLDLPTAAERRRSSCHAEFKAAAYRRIQSELFIESDAAQAEQISRLTGKAVICVGTHAVATRGPIIRLKEDLMHLGRRAKRRVWRGRDVLASLLDRPS